MDQLTNLGADAPAKSDLDILNATDAKEPKADVPNLEETQDEVVDEQPDEEGTELPKEDTEEDVEELEESEEETEEEPEEVSETDDLSLYKQLKKDNPEIFKKYPELRSVIFREQKYSELFPTVEDASEAQTKLKSIDQLESDLISGNSENLFEAIISTDKEAFGGLAVNLLPTIAKLDKDVYAEIIKLPIKRAVQQAYLQAKKAGNTNLMNSALYLDQFYFGEDGIGEDPKVKIANKSEKSPEQSKWEKEKAEHEERLKNDFNTQVVEIIENKLNKEILSSIERFEFDPYKRRNVARDINTEVNRLLASDKRYQASIKSLYSQAQSAKFNGDWKVRITNAYLTRAKAVLPLAKKKVIDEATGKPSGEKKLIKRLTPSNSSGTVPTKLDVKRIDKNKTSEMDILSDDSSRIKYKS